MDIHVVVPHCNNKFISPRGLASEVPITRRSTFIYDLMDDLIQETGILKKIPNLSFLFFSFVLFCFYFYSLSFFSSSKLQTKPYTKKTIHHEVFYYYCYGCSLLVVLVYKKTCNKIDRENQIVSKDEELYMEEEEKPEHKRVIPSCD